MCVQLAPESRVSCRGERWREDRERNVQGERKNVWKGSHAIRRKAENEFALTSATTSEQDALSPTLLLSFDVSELLATDGETVRL